MFDKMQMAYAVIAGAYIDMLVNDLIKGADGFKILLDCAVLALCSWYILRK